MDESDEVLDALARALGEAWCAETSASPDWTPANPALGQCAVTALIVQDIMGGELSRGVVAGVSHYWNVVGGREVDLTHQQFAEYRVTEVAQRERSYVLSFTDTARRYRVLRRRLTTVAPHLVGARV